MHTSQTLGYCRDVISTYQMMNNGRSCSDPSQCYSRRCEGGVCKGLDNNANCNSHKDCDHGYYCN